MRTRRHGQNGLDWQPEAAGQAPMQGQDAAQAQSDAWTGLIHPRAMLAFFRRRLLTIMLVASLVFGLGMVGYLLLPANYSSQALVLVDPRQPRVTLSEDVLPTIGGDAAALTSLVQIMSSDGFLAKAVKALELEKDPSYASAKNEQARINAFRKNMGASRQGATYIVEINVSSKDPQRAARYANGLAELFLAEVNGNRLDASTEAAEWLSQRLSMLRGNLKKSEDAVANYQARAGIVDTGNQNTLDSQQLTSLVTQMANATTEVEDAKARFDQAKRDGVPASSSSGQGDQFLNLNQLMQEQGRLRRQAAELNQTLGARHPRILANKEQQRIIASQVQTEKKRLVKQAGQTYNAAKAKKASLERQLADARSRAIRQNKQSVELANLEREAKANRDLYEQFLARYKITDEQSRLQSDEAKIASPATVPLKSNKLSIKLVAPVLAILGGIMGLVTALIMEAFSTPPSAQAPALAKPVKTARTTTRASAKGRGFLNRKRKNPLEQGELDEELEQHQQTHFSQEQQADQFEARSAFAHRRPVRATLEQSHLDLEDSLEEVRRQKEWLASQSLSPRRRAAIERQMAQQGLAQHQGAQAAQAAALDMRDYGPDPDRDLYATSSAHDVQLDDYDGLEPQDRFSGTASRPRSASRTHDLQGRSRRPQRRSPRSAAEGATSLRDIARVGQRTTPVSPVSYEGDGFEDVESWSESYGNNVHPLYPEKELDDDRAILFSIPDDLYSKLRQSGRYEDSTIRNLADNVLRRNVEVSGLLKDNFNHIDSFLHGSDQQATSTVLVSCMGHEAGQDITADMIRDYAVRLGMRPVLVTLSNMPDRSDRDAGWDGSQIDPMSGPISGPMSGLQEYDDHDVIQFAVNQSLSILDDGTHWSTRALESEQFAHLLQICKRSYDMVIIVAPKGQPQEEMDDILELFDATIVVLDEPELNHQDLSDWQDWAIDANSVLVLDRV